MSKKQIETFVDVTLFKQDIEELVEFFQSHLQDVEIVIDDRHILEITQLEQFEASYQAQSLLARGYWCQATSEDASSQDERLLIELRMNRIMAVLTSWNTVRKSEFLEQLRKVLWRHQTFSLQAQQGAIFLLFLSPLFSVASLLEQQHVYSVLQVLIEIGAGILAVAAFVLLFGFLVTRLKLETRIFLFPGRATT